jgi:PAS domain S-box-containing protein
MPECPPKPTKNLHVVCDTMGKITRISPGMATFLGYAAADLTGRNLFILFPPRAVTPFLDAFSLAYLTGMFKGEMEMVRADGSCFTALLHLAQSKDETGKTAHLVCNVEPVLAHIPA